MADAGGCPTCDEQIHCPDPWHHVCHDAPQPAHMQQPDTLLDNPVEPAPAEGETFETALRLVLCAGPANLQERVNKLRAAHARKVEAAREEGIAVGEVRAAYKYSCGAEKDCQRRPMFCGTHHLQIRNNLMAAAREAGKREAWKEAARLAAQEYDDTRYTEVDDIKVGQQGVSRRLQAEFERRAEGK